MSSFVGDAINAIIDTPLRPARAAIECQPEDGVVQENLRGNPVEDGVVQENLRKDPVEEGVAQENLRKDQVEDGVDVNVK